MVINMQRTLLDKVMQEQMGSVSRGMKILRKNQEGIGHFNSNGGISLDLAKTF